VHASAGYTVNITARVADNGKLATARISVNAGAWQNLTDEGNHRFGYSITGDMIVSGSLNFEIRATDEVGHETVFRPVSAIPVSA
jgi:hypothetical protein